jgi:hypothetical protein
MKTAEMIKNDVEQELHWEPSVCATKIGVSVNGGVVASCVRFFSC